MQRMLCALLLMLGGCAARPPVVVTTAEAGRAVTLGPGDELQVRLAANRTTGYRWQLADDPAPILASEAEVTYEPLDTAGGRLGAGGTDVWRFRAAAAGRTELVFEYWRPWERSATPADSVRFPITVR